MFYKYSEYDDCTQLSHRTDIKRKYIIKHYTTNGSNSK